MMTVVAAAIIVTCGRLLPSPGRSQPLCAGLVILSSSFFMVIVVGLVRGMRVFVLLLPFCLVLLRGGRRAAIFKKQVRPVVLAPPAAVRQNLVGCVYPLDHLFCMRGAVLVWVVLFGQAPVRLFYL
jgi:hypothetical protein